MTDNELIRGIRENSTAAWREIYHANYAPTMKSITRARMLLSR